MFRYRTLVLSLISVLYLCVRSAMGQDSTSATPTPSAEFNPEEFTPAFMASFLMILVSEVGDKTFFIAAVMAMKNARLTVFLGAMTALGLMTILSTALGYAVPNLIPRSFTRILAIILFGFFGVKMLWDAYKMDKDEGQQELEEVTAELDSKERERQDSSDPNSRMESGKEKVDRKNPWKQYAGYFLSPIFIECMTLTFLAEWGDRSQIATIALAAAQNPYGVTLGAVIGHSICTGCAVIGGRILATKISVRSVTFIGGFLFLVFALLDIYQG